MSVIGWEGADAWASDLSAGDVPEPGAGAPLETQSKVVMQRFMHRALGISLKPALNRDGPLRECIDLLLRLRTLRPELDTVMMNLHWAYVQLGEQAAAAALADEFAAGAWKGPQAVAYFARALSASKKYDGALKTLERAATLDDYLGDEIGRERMRAHAGKQDVKKAVAAFARRVDELKSDLDQFHFAYHVFVDMDKRIGELPALLKRPELLAEFKALAECRDAEGRRKLTYVANVGDLLSRIVGPDAQVELLEGAVDEFKGVLGFRHYVYRAALRILETQENPTPD